MVLVVLLVHVVPLVLSKGAGQSILENRRSREGDYKKMATQPVPTKYHMYQKYQMYHKYHKYQVLSLKLSLSLSFFESCAMHNLAMKAQHLAQANSEYNVAAD